MKKPQNIVPKLYPVGTVIVFLLIWELAVRLFQIPDWLLPAPSSVLLVLMRNWKPLWYHSQRTMLEAVFGLLLAAITGFAVGIATSQWQPLKKVLYPLLVISQTIPLIVLAPLLAIWLGFGLLPKLIVVILSCFFPIAFNTVVGLDGADKEMIKLVKSMGASAAQTFKLVKLPQAWPTIFGGLKVSASYCVMAAVVAEWMGCERGLGIYLLSALHAFKTPAVFAGIIIIALVSLLLFALVEAISKLAPPTN